jgi:hypothetical protein
MMNGKSDGIRDIPQELVQLSRHIQRACAAPGHYTITYTVPAHPNQPRQVTISRSEMIRTAEVNRKSS